MSEINPAGAASAPAVFVAPETVDALENRNPAVQRCLRAFERTFHAEMRSRGRGSSARYESRQAAILAFRVTLPDLIGVDNIRDFIACVGAGLAAEILDNCDATRLFYGAQVAIAAAPREVRPPGRPKLNPASEAPQQDTVPPQPPPDPRAPSDC
jgi:hypothetical protein